MVRLFLLFRCLKYYCSCAQGYDGAVFYSSSFPVTKYAVFQECSCQAGKVPQGIADFTCRFFLYGNHAVTSVHAPVVGVYRYGDFVTGIVSAYDVFAFL